MSLRIALAGNPNSGKTTLFNALTGSNQFVGNWPGVTVEKKEGKLKKHDDVTITDLPGIYSLSPYTIEEVVARINKVRGAEAANHKDHVDLQNYGPERAQRAELERMKRDSGAKEKDLKNIRPTKI